MTREIEDYPKTGWVRTKSGRWWHRMVEGKLLCTKRPPAGIRLFTEAAPLRQLVCYGCVREVERDAS